MRERLGALTSSVQHPGDGPPIPGRPYDEEITDLRDRIQRAFGAAGVASPALADTMSIVENGAMNFKRAGAPADSRNAVVMTFVNGLVLPAPLDTLAIRTSIQMELLRP